MNLFKAVREVMAQSLVSSSILYLKHSATFLKYHVLPPISRIGRWLGSHVPDIATVFLALSTALLAYWTHHDAIDQAGIANRQLSQMRAEQRPQVYARFAPADSFSYDDANGALISLSTEYQNTGHGLAQNVAGVISVFLLGQQEYRTVLDMTCNAARTGGQSLGFPLFPGTSVSVQLSSNISPEEFNKKVGVNRSYLWPIVVTCIAYRIPEDPEFHFTVFTYELSMLHPHAGRNCCMIDREDKSIPGSDLKLRLAPMYASFAN
jgi:hypothetical protein